MDGFNLKLMKHGGIIESLRIADIALQGGLGLMIGGMVETSLAMAASAHLAVAVGGFGWIDLDTPLLLRRSPMTGGLDYQGPHLSISSDSGLGVSVGGIVDNADSASDACAPSDGMEPSPDQTVRGITTNLPPGAPLILNAGFVSPVLPGIALHTIPAR